MTLFKWGKLMRYEISWVLTRWNSRLGIINTCEAGLDDARYAEVTLTFFQKACFIANHHGAFCSLYSLSLNELSFVACEVNNMITK